MTNPSLREIDEQFDKRLNNGDWGRPIHVSDLKSFIHKVIAERDEALRKEIEKEKTFDTDEIYPEDIRKFYEGANAGIDKVLAILSKE